MGPTTNENKGRVKYKLFDEQPFFKEIFVSDPEDYYIMIEYTEEEKEEILSLSELPDTSCNPEIKWFFIKEKFQCLCEGIFSHINTKKWWTNKNIPFKKDGIYFWPKP